MSSRHLRAAVIGLMLVATPIAGSVSWAATPVATAASLQGVIAGAARAAAADPTFATKTAEAKLTAIQNAVAAALASSGAEPSVMADALIQAVKSGFISAGVAIAVASTVAPEFAEKVASDPAVKAQLAATGQSATVTGSTNGAGGVSVLLNLQGPTGPGGATGAAYDPCAGVIASYCGT